MNVDVKQGPMWTTDAPFRETPAKIAAYQASGVRVVDMEIAALLSVAAFRDCEVAAFWLSPTSATTRYGAPVLGSPNYVSVAGRRWRWGSRWRTA